MLLSFCIIVIAPNTIQWWGWWWWSWLLLMLFGHCYGSIDKKPCTSATTVSSMLLPLAMMSLPCVVVIIIIWLLLLYYIVVVVAVVSPYGIHRYVPSKLDCNVNGGAFIFNIVCINFCFQFWNSVHCSVYTNTLCVHMERANFFCLRIDFVWPSMFDFIAYEHT